MRKETNGNRSIAEKSEDLRKNILEILTDKNINIVGYYESAIIGHGYEICIEDMTIKLGDDLKLKLSLEVQK